MFSASITFLVGSQVPIDGVAVGVNWGNWALLVIGGFLVTSAANCFNEVIEVDLDKLMSRTKDRPMPSGQMTTGQGLVSGLVMGIVGTYILGSLNLLTGLLSVFSIFLYAFAYTPLKRKSPIAVFVGAFPGALPPLIGYVAAHGKIDEIAIVVFLIQFVWQFPHFWAIAWVLDDDYRKAGFRLLPTTKRDKTSAFVTFVSTVVLIPVSLLPTFMGFGGYILASISVVSGLIFAYYGYLLLKKLEITDARKLMFASFFYLPLVQVALLLDFIGI